MATALVISWASLLFIVFLVPTSDGYRIAINGGGVGNGEIGSDNPSPSPPTPAKKKHYFSQFNPSIPIVVGVITTLFSITFILLLYAKHCKRGSGVEGIQRGAPPSAVARINSGIDRTVVESLPIFQFGSLRGQKDGLECAVCLIRFESSEVLRLLPKCKHAFHVECVDTWLGDHSTCPLCRYRVNPEDILLVEEDALSPSTPPPPRTEIAEFNMEIRRVSGRHSSAGEKRSKFIQNAVQKAEDGISDSHEKISFRRSADSAGLTKQTEIQRIGCYDHPRKDGLLLTDTLASERKSLDHRFEHRIVVSPGSQLHQRWSDVHPSNLLYLRSEMIISDNRRLAVSRASKLQTSREEANDRSVINGRSVSEINGLNRFASNSSSRCSIKNRRHRKSHSHSHSHSHGVASTWMSWISSLAQPGVRPDRTSESVPSQLNSV